MGVRALHHVAASSTASATSATPAASAASSASATVGLSSPPPHPSSAHVLAARYELKKANSESQLVNQLTNLPTDGSTEAAASCVPEAETIVVETPTSPDASSISPAMIKNATETDII